MIIQHELISSFQANADRTAIESDGGTISYAALFHAANRITRYLLNRQLENGRVGVLLDGKADIITAMIGVMNARCTFVPIDPLLPHNRLESMLASLKLDALIDGNTDLGEEDSTPLRYPAFDAEDSVYIYFTSGSTGKPKGIVGKNKSLLQFIQWEISRFGIDASARCSQFISPYFDAFLRDVFVPLCTGGTICIPPEEEDFLSPEKIIAWLNTARISMIHCVPSLFRNISNGNLSGADLAQLRHVFLSGEKIIPAELAKWYGTFGDRVQLVNFYGATESTMIRFYYPIRPEDTSLAKIPIGTPIADTAYLVTKDGQAPCDLLVPGELYIISDYLSKGYLDAPELNEQKFVTLSTADGEKAAYRTGDIARVMLDGNIELMGREDRQVKLRGIRIELDEVELVMLQSQLLSAAVVIKHTVDELNESLAAFVVPQAGAAADGPLTGRLQLYLEAHLPAYMLPSAIIEVEELPLLRNGKTDLKKLAGLLQADEIVEPATLTELKVQAIWKEILGEKKISTEESFIRAGGNSLSTMRLIARIYKEFNVRISLAELFNNLTIKSQAALIDRSRKDFLMVIPQAPPKPAYNLSLAQERVYYSYELNKTGTAYNLPMAWKIDGELDTEIIKVIIRTLIARHESLRTEFVITDGKVMQVIREDLELEIEELSLEGDDIASVMNGFVRPFHLNRAPLLRCAIVSGTGVTKWLLVDVHHIICDGMSQVVLFADFIRLLQGEQLPPLPLQYKDYCEWEYNFRLSDVYNSQREYWLKAFEGGVPQLQLPVAAAETGAGAGASTSFRIEAADLRAFLDFLKAKEITASSGAYALYFLFLAQLTGQEDIVIGTTNTGRVQEELADLTGMFVKMLPIRYAIDMGMTLDAFLTDLHRRLVEANSRSAYDLVNIISDLNMNSSARIEKLFDAAFDFQYYHTGRNTRNDDMFSLMEVETRSAKYPLTLYVIEDEDGAFRCRLEYLSAYFTADDISLLVQQFKLLADRVNENPEAKLSDLIGDTEQPAGFTEEEIDFKF
jgi:amino acid adenylation domain-containing protein